MIRIAVIGLGRRLRELWTRFNEIDPDVRLAAVVEPDPFRAQQSIGQLGLTSGGVAHYLSTEQLLENADQYDAIMIGTRCNLHAQLAIEVAATALPVFLEKPVAITHQQLAELAAAYQGREEHVFVSFPLRYTPLFAKVAEIIRSGRLGTINQVQAWNNVPYGGVYFGEWYRNYEESGGLFLQKATHDFDYINQLVGSRAVSIAATTSRTIFGGQMPRGLMCSECNLTDVCMESPQNLRIRGDEGGAAHHHPADKNHWCMFGEEIKNEDAGSALIMYEGGVHASYSQNFATRRSAGKRGATITGYTGTLEFDWYSEKIRVIHHHTPQVEEFSVSAADGHMGGDEKMLRRFLSMVRGEASQQSTLYDGMVSVAMCLAARDSAQTNTFQPVSPMSHSRAHSSACKR